MKVKASLNRMLIIFLCAQLLACNKNPDPISKSIKDESADYTVSTLAGGDDMGYVNGPGAVARFNYPAGLTTDAANNVYTADRNNFRIRRMAADGQTTTFAGTGVMGSNDGSSTTAQFDFPIWLAMDLQGNLFVVDSMRLRLRKITPSGVVSTMNESRGQFGSMDGLAIDATGNFFIPDGVNRRIKKLSSSGVVTTVAGSGADGYQDGDGGSAKFSLALNHIAIDQQGNVYVNDNSRIRKISAVGVVSTLITIGDPNSPFANETAGAIAVDGQGNVFVGVNHSVDGNYLAKISSPSSLVKIAGAGFGFADGPGSIAKFAAIDYMTIDKNGNIFISDNYRIRKVRKN